MHLKVFGWSSAQRWDSRCENPPNPFQMICRLLCTVYSLYAEYLQLRPLWIDMSEWL